MDWFCFVSVAAQSGVSLGAELLSRLGRFPIRLDLDLFG